MLVLLCYWHLTITPGQIKCCDVLGTSKSINEIINASRWVCIYSGYNNEVDGGDDDQRDERTTLPKNVLVCWLYYLSVVFFLVVISLVSHMLAMAEG